MLAAQFLVDCLKPRPTYQPIFRINLRSLWSLNRRIGMPYQARYARAQRLAYDPSLMTSSATASTFGLDLRQRVIRGVSFWLSQTIEGNSRNKRAFKPSTIRVRARTVGLCAERLHE